MVLTSESVALIIAVVTILSNGLGFLIKTLIDKRKNEDIQQEALKILLRRELSTQHEIYMAKGSISRVGLAEFENTLAVYEKLIGSNGFVTDIANDVRELKVRK